MTDHDDQLRAGDSEAHDSLNRAWDAWVTHSQTDALQSDEPNRSFAMMARFDNAPPPDSEFLASLRRQLLSFHEASTVRRKSRGSVGIVAYPPRSVHPQALGTVWRLAFTALVASILLAALLGGGQWLSGSNSPSFVDSAMASPLSIPVPRPTTTPQSQGDQHGQSDLLHVQSPNQTEFINVDSR